MTTFTKPFEAAVDHAMLYEVGGFWNVNHPAVARGLIDTPANRKAVGYVNDPADRGGETKFGVAVRANPDLNITNLTWDQAKAAYFLRYWIAGKCDKLPARVAVLHFDGCVNHGTGRAAKFLQQAAGVTADGAIGPATLTKVKLIDQFTLCSNICNQREQFYRAIVANDASQARFLNGWLRRINEMRTFTLDKNRSFE
jgi:lysozyme family protein